jgi:hypothetical protein
VPIGHTTISLVRGPRVDAACPALHCHAGGRCKPQRKPQVWLSAGANRSRAYDAGSASGGARGDRVRSLAVLG